MTTPTPAPPPFDALAAVLQAAARYRRIPERSYTPPATSDNPNPAPVVMPAHDVLDVDPASLPEVVVQPGGGVDLGAQVALLHEAVRRMRSQMRLRSVHGQATFNTTLVWAGNSEREIPITWSTPALAPVEAAFPRMDVGVAWQGRLSARIKDGSLTETGCTVIVSVVGTSQVVITATLPLTVHADGLYQYLPPYQGGTP